MKINLNFLKHQTRRENNIFFFLNHSETRALALGVEDPFQIYFLYRSEQQIYTAVSPFAVEHVNQYIVGYSEKHFPHSCMSEPLY